MRTSCTTRIKQCVPAILVEKSAGDSFPERLKPLVLIQTSGFFVSTGANHSEKGGV